MGDHKNTIIAIVLSLLVVVGWQYFVGYPQMERQRQQAELKQQEQSQTQPGATNRARHRPTRGDAKVAHRPKRRACRMPLRLRRRRRPRPARR